ncbi:MAG: hypothetical protein J7530_13625 [Novosphingobium sp.]|nr:hypothetical protein [Novosphingobium sp.]
MKIPGRQFCFLPEAGVLFCGEDMALSIQEPSGNYSTDITNGRAVKPEHEAKALGETPCCPAERLEDQSLGAIKKQPPATTRPARQTFELRCEEIGPR